MGAKEGARRNYTEKARADALRLYVEHGPAEASRRTGIPAATIRKWAEQAGRASTRSQSAAVACRAARLTWAQRRAEVAVRAGEAAGEFLERAVGAERPRDARDAMAAFSMAVDKAQLLDGAATERLEVSEDEQRAWVRRMRDELAERRRSRAR